MNAKEKLPSKQLHYYNYTIKPLVKNVNFEGVIEGMCPASGTVEDQILTLCYIEEKFVCDYCRGESSYSS